jgi:hypothetical protein
VHAQKPIRQLGGCNAAGQVCDLSLHMRGGVRGRETPAAAGLG